VTEDRWLLLGDLFDRALDQPPERRGDWLDEACPDDPRLRHELESMLAAHDRAEGILERSLPPVVPTLASLGGIGLSELDHLSDLSGWLGVHRPLEDEDRSGEEVGPYRLESEIGRGGMGVVYKARDPRLDRFVALKFLPSSLAAHRETHARFLAEAKAASALDHAAICTVYDLGETGDGQLYIAMAYYPGSTLASRLSEGPLPIADALRVARHVAAGLARAHEAGIIHRDIKPSNLLITERGDAKILDFGVAKLEGGTTITQPGSLVGTITYMSPEQISGDELDPRSDLWSLGAVLYEMLAGCRPFPVSDPAAALEAILGREPEPLREIRPEVPEELEAIVLRLLAKAPRDRYATAEDVLRDLELLDEGGSGSFAPFERSPPDGLDTASGLPVSGVAVSGVAAASGVPGASAVGRLVGRAEEVARACELLESARLLTLTGPAGAGKTRLALEVVRRVRRSFPGGTHFVPLAELPDPALVPSALAVALGVSVSPSQTVLESLRRTLGGRRVLLVLDNFEHVATAAPVLAELLTACSGLRLLVTSRVALRLSTEHELPVSPLALPETGSGATVDAVSRSAAVQLFVERARAARPDFELTDDNVRAVAQIAVRLGGLPLALELAAARIKLFSPRALLELLEGRRGKGLDLLTGGAVDLPDRHRTLRRALDWSYRLLEPEQRQVFRRLSVFVGELSLTAAESVCADLAVDHLACLAALVDQSLLQRREGPEGEPLFALLAIVRDFASEKLVEAGEDAAGRRAHAVWCLQVAERTEPGIIGPDPGRALHRLESMHGNLRAALEWIGEVGESELGLRLGAALWRFWLVRGYLEEGCRSLRRVLELEGSDGPSDLRARALNGLGTLTHNRGDAEAAHTYLAGSLAIYRYLGDRRGVARLLDNLAWLACERAELAKARALSEEALELHEGLDDPRGVAVALSHLGWAANFAGELQEARRFGHRSLELRRTLGDRGGIVFALVNLAWAERLVGELEEAEQLLGEALDMTEEMGDLLMRGFARLLWAEVLRDLGRCEAAAEQLGESLASWRRSGNRSGAAWALCSLGQALLDLGRTDEAETRLEEGLELWRGLGRRWGEALGLLGLARLRRIQGRPGAAWRRLREYLEAVEEVGSRRSVPPGLELASGWWAEERPERSARLLAAASKLRAEMELALPPRLAPVRAELEAVLRETLGDAGYRQACQAGRELAADAAAIRELLG